MFFMFVGGMVKSSSHRRTYGFNTVSIWERPNAVFLEIAIRRKAHMNQHVDMLAATSIKNDRYVDNLSRVCCSKEVARFMGKETDDRFQQDANMLSKMSLKLKVMVNNSL